MKRLPNSLSINAFRDAWKNSRDSKSGSSPGASGVDGVRGAMFASELASQIIDIRIAIRDGSYRFNKLRLAPVPKNSGGYRIIAVPTVKDRLVQRAILRGLEKNARFKPSSPIAYGFTKGRTLADAQRAALALRSGYPWMLQADIVKFFDKIDRAYLRQLIIRNVKGKVVSGLLCAAIDCEIEDVGGKGAELIRDSEIERGVGLRQGMPVSPMLSNLLLKSFDEALAKRGLLAIRYADDIAVFGKSREEMADALKFIQEMLGSLKLKVPEIDENGKTTIKGPSEAVGFLGVEIRRASDEGYILAAPNKKLTAIEEEMARMVSISECVKYSRNIGHIVRWLDAFIIGHAASMAVLNDPRSFLDRLEAAKERQLNVLLTELIGEKAVKGLDADRRAILGLQRFS